ncbi:hypothetical protein B296_00055684 [Ensete ventricosum]|uniref:Uncharacterized protein n=1 Tax=Ensete ventricosum TaxID=4639 RepID=A0A426X448_ENSVE|nr:hypothetical protein B296_00055684 [Ensete ventricosum]
MGWYPYQSIGGLVCIVRFMPFQMVLQSNVNLTLTNLREIDEDALEQALSAAVTCTILAAAGPQRSRVLATLYKVPVILVHHENVLFLSNSVD